MTKKNKEKLMPQNRGRAPLILAAVIVMFCVIGFTAWKFRGSNVTSLDATSAEAINPKLKGKWLRQDGDYTIEIREILSGGMLDAKYFNPGPIHVHRAEAKVEGTEVKVYVELRDANYPGSYYTLIYDPATDQLRGAYFHAVLQEVFDVSFMRLPASAQP